MSNLFLVFVIALTLIQCQAWPYSRQRTSSSAYNRRDALLLRTLYDILRNGVFEDQTYNDPIGEFTDYERRTYAYGASRKQIDDDVNDDVNDDVSDDESLNDENKQEMKEWFLGEIDEHRRKLASKPKEVKKEVKNKGESEEDREALRREEEKNERELAAKRDKRRHVPLPGQLFEDDIYMTRHLHDHISGADNVKRDALKYAEYQWPKEGDVVKVPYEMNDNFNSLKRERLKQAIDDYHKYTCIRFIPKEDHHKDYLHFFSNKSMCYSSVGMQGGKQKISIGDGCERKGTVIHEMLHSIGFIHEQSRPDRDEHVKVLWDNIKGPLKHNFQKYPGYLVTSEDVPYDFDSVLHYHNSAFTKNGEPTLMDIEHDGQDKDRKFGQRIGFSKRNVEQVNALYRCVVDNLKEKMDDLEYE